MCYILTGSHWKTATMNTTFQVDPTFSPTTEPYTANVSSTVWEDSNITWTESSANASTADDHKDASLISSSRLIETMYLLIGSVGLIDNTIVVFVFMSAPALRKKITNMYIINQSCIDSMVAVCLLAYSGLSSDVPYSGTAGVVYCMFWQSRSLLWGLLNSSTYNLVLLSFERYCAIVHPIFWKTKVTRKLAAISMGVVWVFGVVWEGAGKVPSTHIVNGKCSLYTNWPTNAARKAYGINVFVGKLFIPLLLLCYAYGRIVWTLHIKVSLVDGINFTETERYRKVSNIRRTICQIIKDLVGAAPTGDAPTTSELSTVLLPTKVRLILETLR